MALIGVESAADTRRTNWTRQHPPEIADLFAVRDLGGFREGLSVSPDGRSLATFERETDLAGDGHRYRLLVIDSANGVIDAIAQAGGFVLHRSAGRPTGLGMDRVAKFSPDGVWVYYLAERDGAVELWRASARGAQDPHPIAQRDGDIMRFALSRDGHAVIFETITPRTTLAVRREEQVRHGFRLDESLAPSFSLMPLPDEEAGRRIWRLDIDSGRVDPATDDEVTVLNGPLDERVSIRPVDAESPVQNPALGLFFRAAASEKRCAAEQCSGALKSAWTSEDHVTFIRLEGHAESYTAIYVWTPGEPSARLIRREQEVLFGCQLAGAALYCLQETTFQPRRVVAIDTLSGALRPVYDPNPQWQSVALPRTERMDFTDAKGNESFARLIYPLNYPRERCYPLVAMQYRSRGFLRAGTGGETPVFPLSARGYFVLTFDRPEFRTRRAQHTAHEMQRDDALLGLERSAKQEALLHFIGQALATGAVDSRRMAITGTSDGAELAYHLLIDKPNLFAVAAMSTPPIDPIAWPLQSEQFRRKRFADVGMTSPWGDANAPWTQWWRRASPFHNTEVIRAPILINLAESEALRAFPMVVRLRETTTPTEAYVYPGAYHIKARPQQVLAAQIRTLAWLDFWIKGSEAYDRTDPERKRRWRSMRERMRSGVHSTAVED